MAGHSWIDSLTWMDKPVMASQRAENSRRSTANPSGTAGSRSRNPAAVNAGLRRNGSRTVLCSGDAGMCHGSLVPAGRGRLRRESHHILLAGGTSVQLKSRNHIGQTIPAMQLQQPSTFSGVASPRPSRVRSRSVEDAESYPSSSRRNGAAKRCCSPGWRPVR